MGAMNIDRPSRSAQQEEDFIMAPTSIVEKDTQAPQSNEAASAGTVLDPETIREFIRQMETH